MKNRIEDLRDHLFATLEELRDKDKPMELERAKAIADVAQTIINSAKVEVDYLRAVSDRDKKGTTFIPADKSDRPAPLRAISAA